MDTDTTPRSPLSPFLFLLLTAGAVVGSLIVWAATGTSPLDVVAVWFDVVADMFRAAWNLLLGILPW